MSEPTVVIEELRLRRYAARSRFNELTFEGSTVSFHMEQEPFEPEGEHRALAHIVSVGRRSFGGLVHFDSPARVTIEGTAWPEDEADLASLGRQLVDALAELCRCGLMAPECACCHSCQGRGTRAGESQSVPCEACGGAGVAPTAEPPST